MSLIQGLGRSIHRLCHLVERNEDLFGGRRSEVQVPLSYLDRLENGWNLDPRVKDDIHTLKLMISILVPFSGFISEWSMKGQLKINLNRVASVIKNVIQALKLSGLEVQFSVDADGRTPSAIAKYVIPNLEKLRLLRPEVKELHFVVSRSSKPFAAGNREDAIRFLNLLCENVRDILRCEAELILLLKQQIEVLETELNFLRCFLHFLSKICNWHEYLNNDLFVFAEGVAVDTACVLYFLLVDKMIGQDMLQENKSELLYLVGKIRPFQPEVREIYTRALEASRSVIIGPLVPDDYVLGFFDSLVHKLREMSKNKSNFEIVPEDPNEILLEELSSVRCYLINTPLHYCKEGLDNLMIELIDLIMDLGTIIFSDEGLESRQIFADVMDKIRFIKSASGDFLIPGTWQSNFPRTDELAFINFIITNMSERLNFNIVSDDQLKCEITMLYEELVALRDDFVKIIELRKEDEGLSSLNTLYRDVAYQAEYFVDLSLFGDVPLQYIWSGLTDIKESIRQIQTEVKAIAKNMTHDNLAHCVTDDLLVVSSESVPAFLDAPMCSKGGAGSNSSEATYQLVGLEDEARKVMDQLTRGSKQLTILSIVGMPGIGKTTLANFVYKDPSVIAHFHAQAWFSVSQAYERQTLLLEILHQVHSGTMQDRQENVDLDQKLYQSLKGRRYLVILDDIWDDEVWADLKLSFPDDNNGSRLVFTTRNSGVAFHANSVPHNLQLLSDEDSWKLLQVKVFEKETCPPALSGIGKRIVESCSGLPLAIVLIAGLLKTTEGNQDSWERIGNQLRSYIVDYPPGQQLGTLELSYMHLPDYLKPCFLYFGAFQEDAEIPIRKLVHLWIAEGFVQPPKVQMQNSLENEAEKYLNALIDRSLVIVAKRSSRGGVKTCRIHDLLHEFCLVRAKEERFLLPRSKYTAFPTLSRSKHVMPPTFRISEMHEQYRLCIFSNSIPLVRMGNFAPRVRTLLFPSWRFSLPGSSSRPGGHDHLNVIDQYGEYYFIPAESVQMSRQRFSSAGSSSKPVCHDFLCDIGILNKFILLRVLDLRAVYIGDESIFITISQLFYLRYVAVRAYITKIPIEVANLKNLQTFLLSTGPWEIAVLAETILSMVSLRHLLIRDGHFNFQLKFFQKFWKLENLTTLSTPALYSEKNIEMMMRNLPNLQKLRCKFLDSWDPKKRCNHFPVLDFLHRLESLNVTFSGKGLYPCNLNFPSSIKKLTLSDSRLPWDEISIIGKLPQLEVLKLLNRAFEGRKWYVKDGEFQKLKFLKLHCLDIVKWDASSEQFPCLEQLLLESCSYLEEIPSVFGEIPTLWMIDMKWCSTSAVQSVKQIEEDQHDMGNDQFNVLIKHI